MAIICHRKVPPRRTRRQVGCAARPGGRVGLSEANRPLGQRGPAVKKHPTNRMRNRSTLSAAMIRSLLFRLGRLLILGKETSQGRQSLFEEPFASGLLEAFGAKLLLTAVAILEDSRVPRAQILTAAAVAVARTSGAVESHGLGLERGDDSTLDEIIRLKFTIMTDATDSCQDAGFSRFLMQGGDKMIAAAPDPSCPFACDYCATWHLTYPGVLPDPSVGAVNSLTGNLRLDEDESRRQVVWGRGGIRLKTVRHDRRRLIGGTTPDST